MYGSDYITRYGIDVLFILYNIGSGTVVLFLLFTLNVTFFVLLDHYTCDYYNTLDIRY